MAMTAYLNLLGSEELFSDNEFSQGMQLSVLCLKHNIESYNFTGDTDQFPEGEIALDMLHVALYSEMQFKLLSLQQRNRSTKLLSLQQHNRLSTKLVSLQ